MLVYEAYGITSEDEYNRITNDAKNIAYSKLTYGEIHREALEYVKDKPHLVALFFMFVFGEACAAKELRVEKHNFKI